MQHLNTLTQKYQGWERLRTPPNSCQPVFKLSAQCVSARASLTLAAAHTPPSRPQESSAYDKNLWPIHTSSGDREDLMLLSHVDWLHGLLEVKFILFAQNIHTEGPAPLLSWSLGASCSPV